MIQERDATPPAGDVTTLIRSLLASVGEDPDREGLQKTPERVAEAFSFFTQGYEQDVDTIIGDALFEVPYSEMVIVRDIDFASLCEHHLLPFFGRAHVACIPNGRILGLSKLARLIEVFSRRLQVQERLTKQVAALLQDALEPKGVAVVIEAQHLCMMMRGVQKQNSYAITSSLLGEFESDPKTRSEVMELMHRHRSS